MPSVAVQLSGVVYFVCLKVVVFLPRGLKGLSQGFATTIITAALSNVNFQKMPSFSVNRFKWKTVEFLEKLRFEIKVVKLFYYTNRFRRLTIYMFV